MLCEENAHQLYETLDNLLSLKLLHEYGINVQKYPDFTTTEDINFSGFEIFKCSLESLFGTVTSVEEVNINDFEYTLINVRSDLFNGLTKEEKSKFDMTTFCDLTGMEVRFSLNTLGMEIILDPYLDIYSRAIKEAIDIRKKVDAMLKQKKGDTHALSA